MSSRQFRGLDTDWRWRNEAVPKNLCAGSGWNGAAVSRLLGWLLYETQRESLQDVIQYEAAQMDLQMQRFRDAVQTKKMTGESDSRVKESVLAYQFRSIFGSDGALFLDGEEQYNRTPYTYDIKNLRNMQSQEDYYFNLNVSSVQTVHGKRLILFTVKKVNLCRRERSAR